MPVYNDRQVRHLYVAMQRYAAATDRDHLMPKTEATAIDQAKDASAKAAAAYVPGSIQCNTIMKGKALQFMYKNATGEYITSDVIPIANIRNVTKSTPKGMAYKTHTITVGSNVTVGEDYVLRFDFKAWYTPDTSKSYIKDIVYRAKTDDTAEKVAEGLEKSFNEVFKREPWIPFTISRKTNVITLVEKNSDEYWHVDRCHEVPTQCTITTAYIYTYDSNGKVTGEKYDWATIETATKYYGNARETAQLEYQCMKGRADLYGYMGYPNINPSTMMITGKPAATDNYVYLDIQYAFAEDGTNNAFSEKEITIVSKTSDIIDNLEKEVGTAISKYMNPVDPAAVVAASVQTQSAPAKADKTS